jgi:ParB-like chromosome segregation protein Spo0J|tara:strand:- start:1846 stop:2415 length:570 start_codon:yes stop_codon:yes gene_type:complete
MSNLKIKSVDIDSLIGAEYNPRILKEDQFQQLKNSIQRFGFVEPVIVNINVDRKNIIISGHQRTNVARALGITKIPIIELDLTPEKEKELNIRMNKNGGEWDYDMLANGEFDSTSLIEWGFQDYEVGGGEDVNLDDFFEENPTEKEDDILAKISIVLEYTEEEHEKVINALSELGSTPEDAVYKLLKLD